jgi:integrase/recombinase XerD
MVAAMVLGGLRRCEVLGLRLDDLRAAERRLFIAEGKGGRQRLIPVLGRFFTAVAAYLDAERPADAGPTGSSWCSRVRAAVSRCRLRALMKCWLPPAAGPGWTTQPATSCATTCLTRLREAGMALEAVQAQAGHASIESTRIYLHLADDWLAAQYRKAAEVIDAQVFAVQTAGPGAAAGSPW